MNREKPQQNESATMEEIDHTSEETSRSDHRGGKSGGRNEYENRGGDKNDR